MINKVILVGNVGGDPEVRTTESGVKVARIRLATSERYTDKQSGERKELTEWHTITLWRGLADIVDRYVHKGSQLYIEGRLRTREWTDTNNIKRYTTEILADNMQLLGSRSDGQSAAPVAAPSAPAAAPSAPAQPAYQQQAAQPAPAAYQQPASIPAPQDDPDDLPF